MKKQFLTLVLAVITAAVLSGCTGTFGSYWYETTSVTVYQPKTKSTVTIETLTVCPLSVPRHMRHRKNPSCFSKSRTTITPVTKKCGDNQGFLPKPCVP
jgi:hypothetical protein